MPTVKTAAQPPHHPHPFARCSSAVRPSLAQPTEADQDAVGLVLEDEQDDQCSLGCHPEPAETVLIKARAVELILQPLRCASA
jgi:hypothetical protein